MFGLCDVGFEEEKNCTSQRGQFLNNFDSPRDFSDFCLAHVFTYRDFDNGTAGLASVGTGLLIIIFFCFFFWSAIQQYSFLVLSSEEIFERHRVAPYPEPQRKRDTVRTKYLAEGKNQSILCVSAQTCF